MTFWVKMYDPSGVCKRPHSSLYDLTPEEFAKKSEVLLPFGRETELIPESYAESCLHDQPPGRVRTALETERLRQIGGTMNAVLRQEGADMENHRCASQNFWYPACRQGPQIPNSWQ